MSISHQVKGLAAIFEGDALDVHGRPPYACARSMVTAVQRAVAVGRS